jgi:hypothetical protein
MFHELPLACNHELVDFVIEMYILRRTFFLVLVTTFCVVGSSKHCLQTSGFLYIYIWFCCNVKFGNCIYIGDMH